MGCQGYFIGLTIFLVSIFMIVLNVFAQTLNEQPEFYGIGFEYLLLGILGAGLVGPAIIGYTFQQNR